MAPAGNLGLFIPDNGVCGAAANAAAEGGAGRPTAAQSPADVFCVLDTVIESSTVVIVELSMVFMQK